MNIVILVTAPPTDANAQAAHQFCLAALQQDHHITQIFFYSDGVYNALSQQWDDLAKQHAVPLNACITACTLRGVTESDECPHFSITGSGQFIEAVHHADRCVEFSPS